MRIIPVLDVQNGRAVAARAGDRSHYRPVQSILHEGSDPVGLARAYRDVLGLRDIYLADLDAIAGGPPSLALYREVADLGIGAWVDAGIRGVDDVAPILDAGATTIVAGLETLRGPEELTAIRSRFGSDRVVFSLDLLDGRPLVPSSASWGTDDPRAIAEEALSRGMRRLILLDLARIGAGSGVGTLDLARALGAGHPGIELTLGGGIAGSDDLQALRDAGASAVLVGSALHDGRMGRGEALTAD